VAASQSTFMLSFRRGIWHVRCNGLFFGDYRSEHDALAGIAEAQRKLSAPAKIVRAEHNQPYS
jgi:hypothetical protein